MSCNIGTDYQRGRVSMKSLENIPPPLVCAGATSRPRRASPRATLTCPPRSRAVYDAREATRMDRATRYGLYVPVTTIGWQRHWSATKGQCWPTGKMDGERLGESPLCPSPQIGRAHV